MLTIGKYTYAFVDLDVWLWAIVTNYRGPQEFGEVVTAFAEGFEPDHQTVTNIMKAMQ